MTVSSTAASTPATGNGATTVFPFNFACRSVEEVAVYVNGVLTPGGYSVQLNVGYNGGSVTFTAAPANGAAIIIASAPAFDQETSFENAGPYNPSMVDAVADEAAIRDIYLNDQISRSVRVPVGEAVTAVPPLATRRNMLASWDVNGDPTVTDPTAILGTKGDPGGNAMAIGVFTGAGALNIPVGTDLVQTSGYSAVGKGAGLYAYDAAVNAAYVTAHPRSSFVSSNGRGFKLYHPNCITPLQFGAVGDGVTDDSAAFVALLAFVREVAQQSFNYGWGTYRIFVPAGRYWLNVTTLDIDVGVHMYGEGTGFMGGSASVLHWADATTGIRTQRQNTSGASGVGGTAPGSDGSVFEHLGLQGGYAGATSESHGFHCRAPVIIRDCIVRQFPGDGIYARCQVGGGGALEGEFSLSRIERVWLEQNRNGVYIEGADANASLIDGCSAVNNRSWGFWDNSFLGNFFRGNHTSANTLGPYRAEPTQLNAACTFADCYSESNQPASVFAPKTLFVGGFHAAGVTGGAGFAASNSKLNTGGLAIAGDCNVESLTVNSSSYATGVQPTNKGTGLTINAEAGMITMSNAALAAGAAIGFTLANNKILSNESIVYVHVAGGASFTSYHAFVDVVSQGNAHIVLQNISAGSLSEAVQISFIVFNVGAP